MKKRTLLLLYLIGVTFSAFADIPDGYYTLADGYKYTDLKTALCNIIKDHKTFKYSSLWDYYPYTYYVIENPSQVLDMYSDNITYFSNTTALNKEHTVPKSWWGGSTSMGPGCDIFNVIPSDQQANSAKSNYPLGVVAGKPRYDNGVTKIGDSGVNGYNGLVFEPKDTYKGDFARIYFYVATCYPDLAWDSNKAKAMTNKSEMTLQDWIIPMLLEWNAQDPVDDAEIQRNEDVYKQQGNRNPFIDYPSLADYIWGDKKNEIYVFADHDSNQGSTTEFKTHKPSFSVEYGTKDNPKNIADNSVITIKGGTTKSILYTRINDSEWEATMSTTGWNPATSSEYSVAAQKDYTISGDTHIEAYCTLEGYENSDTISAYYKGVSFENDYIFYEAFDDVTSGNNTSNSGSSSYWSGNDNFINLETVFQAGNAVRLGSSKSNGVMETRTLTTKGGTLEVEFDVKGWTSVEGDVVVELTGAGQQTVTYTATMTDPFEHVKLIFNNVSANPTMTISTSVKRAFIDNITVKQLTADKVLPQFVEPKKHEEYNMLGQKIIGKYKGIKIIKGKKILCQ
jgi:endonuclease I